MLILYAQPKRSVLAYLKHLRRCDANVNTEMGLQEKVNEPIACMLIKILEFAGEQILKFSFLFHCVRNAVKDHDGYFDFVEIMNHMRVHVCLRFSQIGVSPGLAHTHM